MRQNRRKICFITGTRADFGILTPVMKAVELSNKLKLQLIVTGMHLLPQFGRTIDEIKKEGFSIDAEIDISDKKGDNGSMSRSVGKAILEFTIAFEKIKPDIVVVLGDRGEMLAGAIAANYLEIPVAHIHGGEVSGHVDGIIRHAITKLSHIHFAATDKARERIIKLGEEPKRVYVSGAPALDRIINEKLLSKSALYKKYGLDKNKALFIVAEHPVSMEFGDPAKKIRETLEATLLFKTQTLVIYPNSDAGGKQMIGVIENFKDSRLILVKSMSHKDYLGLLKSAQVLIGNSSSGIIEAPSFNLPVVNIGTRQNEREHGLNVINSDYGKKNITEAINKAIEYGTMVKKKNKKVVNPYGDGQASQRIVLVLEKTSLGNDLLSKQITY